MENFFTHSCHKCGGVDEAKFVLSGPHVKQVCLHCGFYVKFAGHAIIPDIAEIRLRIWQISKGNVEIIEAAKVATGYVQIEDKLLHKIQWWRVYLRVRATVPSNYE
jgi:hypothetical protein